jgi:hypothetical protein
VFGAVVCDAVLDVVLNVLRGRGDGLTNVVGLVLAFVLVAGAGFLGADLASSAVSLAADLTDPQACSA